MRYLVFVLYLLILLPVVCYVLVEPEVFWAKLLMWTLFIGAAVLEWYFDRKKQRENIRP